ncbi:MAG: hypothetical protein H7257_08715 [Taibaiella sp.]|nr:hypothetical protein [Taibaiella sp.]
MEIAKYIGQFILKNNFCYIHGLGNLELVKRPAINDGKSLQGPTYEVILTAGGSIDDSFANFIATNEQISISKAANGLRDFSMQSRKDMQEGKEVALPGLGKLLEQNGKVKFITDAHFNFSPAGMPSLKNSRQVEEQKTATTHKPTYPAPAKANSVNWSMVIIAGIIVVLLAGGGIGYYFYNKPAETNVAPVPVVVDTVVSAPVPVIADTLAKPTDTVKAAPPAIDTLAVMPYRVVLGRFIAREKAEKRFRQLKVNGNKVDLITQDSLNFILLTTVNARMVDTTHMKDSLRKLFGYNNLSIYKE